MLCGIFKYADKVRTSDFIKSAIGLRSTPPSPYFVKKPTPKSSILFPVPTTKELVVPAKKYNVVIRNRAREFPRERFKALSLLVKGICAENWSKTGLRFISLLLT